MSFQSDLKQFKKQKARALLFDGLYFDGKYSVSSLTKEQAPFLPIYRDKDDEDKTKIENPDLYYVKAVLQFIFVSSDLMTKDELKYMESIKDCDIQVVMKLPVYIPIFNNLPHVFNFTTNIATEVPISLEARRIYNDENITQFREKMNAFTFIMFEGKHYEISQYSFFRKQFNHHYLNVLSKQEVSKLMEVVLEKNQIIEKRVDIVKVLLDALSSKECYQFLMNFDYSKIPLVNKLDEFLKLPYFRLAHKNYMSDDKIEKLDDEVQSRFLSCVAKQYDMSWAMNETRQRIIGENKKEKPAVYYWPKDKRDEYKKQMEQQEMIMEKIKEMANKSDLSINNQKENTLDTASNDYGKNE